VVEVAQDRVRQRSFVLAVLNVRVLLPQDWYNKVWTFRYIQRELSFNI
jgi:hypothetical protein